MEAILQAKIIIFMYNLHENSLHAQFFQWAIPENIHTQPRTASMF